MLKLRKIENRIYKKVINLQVYYKKVFLLVKNEFLDEVYLLTMSYITKTYSTRSVFD